MRFYDPISNRWHEDIDGQLNLNLPEKVSMGNQFAVTYPFVDLHTHVRLNDGEDYK